MRQKTQQFVSRRRRGVTLIEAALTLGIIAIVMVGLTQMLSGAAETTRARSVADRLQQVTAASQAYLKANYAKLFDAAGSGVLTVPVASGNGPAGLPNIKDAGYLPANFVNRNAYNQEHVLPLRRTGTSPNLRLEGIITTKEGVEIPDRQLGQIASFAGAQAGFMMSNPPNSGATNTVSGLNGGWTSVGSDWGLAHDSSKGHVMAAISSNEGVLIGDYLNRNDVGIPEANTMRTDIDMGDNQINNVSRIDNQEGGVGGALTLYSDKVEIGPNLSVTGYITAGTTITAGSDVRAGLDVAAVRNVNAGNNVTAGKDVLAKQNVNADNNVAAGNDVTAGRNVIGRRFNDSDNTSYFVDPNSESHLHALDADYLNADARLYTGAAPSAGSSGTMLKDRLPNYVQKNGFTLSGSGNATTGPVAKPSCGTGGSPKIILTPLLDGHRFNTLVTAHHSGDNIVFTNNPISTSRAYSVDSSWRVSVMGDNLSSWSVFASTYCYYPDL